VYRIGICDDDQEFMEEFKEQVEEFFENRSISCELCCYSSLEKLAQAQKREAFDLLVLDILLDGENGMEYARKLRREGNSVKLIFVTFYEEYAVDSYDVFPMYYLIKPLDHEKLKKALLRALSAGSCTLAFETAKKTLLVDSDSIYYMEIYNHSILIHKTDGTVEKVSGNLNNVENRLPDLLFVRIHRSYLVNLKYIQKIHHYYVVLPGGVQLPVARNRFGAIRSTVLEKLYEKSLFL
jgi:two-component system response regulator LytT